MKKIVIKKVTNISGVKVRTPEDFNKLNAEDKSLLVRLGNVMYVEEAEKAEKVAKPKL